MADIARLRNIAFVGTHHAGKTTLVEAVLAKAAPSDAAAPIADGTTVTDHEPEDIAHVQSTRVGFAHAVADGIDITIVDCPGFVDFFEETRVALYRRRCRGDRRRSRSAGASCKRKRWWTTSNRCACRISSSSIRWTAPARISPERSPRCRTPTAVTSSPSSGRSAVPKSFRGYVDLAEMRARGASTATRKPTTRSRRLASDVRAQRAANCSKRWPTSTIT